MQRRPFLKNHETMEMTSDNRRTKGNGLLCTSLLLSSCSSKLLFHNIINDFENGNAESNYDDVCSILKPSRIRARRSI